MAALATLRRAATEVCTQIERGWKNRFLPPVYVPPRYEMDLLEKRQLLSVAAHITGPAEVTEGDPYVLSLSASSTASTYTVQNWSISYGDGGSHLLFGDSVADLYTFNTASSPTFDITATVTDLEGTITYSGSTSMSVTVDEATASLYLSPGEAAAVGQPFDLYQELSDGGAHTVSAYSVAWGDSSSDSDSTTPETITSGYANDFSHTYSAAGTYSVTGTAVTEQGTVTATTAIVAEPISVTGPTNGYVAGSEYNLTPTFDDPGHTLGSYIVSWGDGSSDDTYAASATSFGHTYSAGGQSPYEATVQAIADDGTWTAYAEADPLAAVWPDNGTTANRGDTVYLNGSFDANGDEPTSWFVSWGDGSTGTYSSSDESLDGQGGIGGPMDATHNYTADGTYTVAAIGTDSVGSYTAQSTTIEVDEPTPTFSVDGDSEFTKGQAYDLTPSFSISSGDTPNNYFVDWGDGSSEATYSGTSTDLAHTYTTGTPTGFTINATVVTDFGTYTDSTSVDETPPTVSFTGPDSVTAGQTATFSTGFDDPNGNTPTGWTVYWGDGHEDETTTGDPSSLTHVYTASPDGGGDWTVMAMASEVDGDFWAEDATVAVTADDPLVSLAVSGTATAGIDYTATESYTDPAGRSPYDWVINWGDSGVNYFYDGPNPTIDHDYTLPGSYSVTANAIVAPLDPAATLNEVYTATNAVEVTDSASWSFDMLGALQAGGQSEAEVHFYDPDGVTPDSCTISWGSGVPDTYGTNPDYNGTFAHTYNQPSAPGDLTVTAIAHTVEGDFTATQAVEILPPDVGVVLDAPLYAKGGQSVPVEAFFLYDEAGNATSEFPVAGAHLTYSVNWGDGSSDANTGNPMLHVYPYRDPHSFSNSYEISVTVTAPNEDFTSVVGTSVDILPEDGSGDLEAGDMPSPVTEGQATGLDAGFSDSAQNSTDGDVGAAWTVWWGDGNSTTSGDLTSEFSPSHVYAEPGTYAVTLAADYEENHDPTGMTNYVAISGTGDIYVDEHTPTLSATAVTDTLTVGDKYILQPTYIDPIGDHRVNTLTVDWGDETTSVYACDGEDNAGGPYTHVYATDGGFEPSLIANAFGDDLGITGTAGIVDVLKPTLSISADGDATADENGQQPAILEITRTGTDFLTPLRFEITSGGSLADQLDPHDVEGGRAFALVESDGELQEAGQEMTIPVGQATEMLYVYPLEDHTPRWTETVDVTLSEATDGEDYTLASASPGSPPNTAAGVYVVNDDAYAWLDNGSDNDIFEGGSTADGGTLVPLVLDLPEEVRNGAEITLVDNAPTEADVYTTPDPGDSDTPILGDVSGTTVSEVTWTQGTDDTAPHGQTTLWVEGISGSASINDISFEAHDDDSGTDADAEASKPELPQGDPDQPDTDVLAPTNAAATKLVQIQYLGQYVTGASAGTVIVGQGISLKAVYTGPLGAFPRNTTFEWSIPGIIVGDYSESVDAGFTTPARLNQSSVLFFWLDGGNAQQGVNRTVTLTAAGFTEGTTFTVVSPTAEIQTQTGQVVVKNNVGGNAKVGDVTFQGTDYGGIYFKMVNPAIPANFTGTWDWTQVESSTYSLTDNNNVVHNEVDNFWTLDAGHIPANLPQPTKGYHYNVEGSNDTADEPLLGGDSTKYKAFSADFTADMYLMFQPSTALSIEVPIRVVPWYWGGNAVWDPTFKNPNNTTGAWVPGNVYWSANPSDQATHSPPTWSRSNHHPYAPPL